MPPTPKPRVNGTFAVAVPLPLLPNSGPFAAMIPDQSLQNSIGYSRPPVPPPPEAVKDSVTDPDAAMFGQNQISDPIVVVAVVYVFETSEQVPPEYVRAVICGIDPPPQLGPLQVAGENITPSPVALTVTAQVPLVTWALLSYVVQTP